MINSVDNNKIQNLLTQQPANQAKNAVASNETDKNAELQQNSASLIEKAIQADSQKGLDAVQNAKKLLLSGELDNIDNIRKAAQNIIDFGI
ncbi:MAG TPA: hypothetical protein PLP05_01290 [Sedimentisphaerales bacterium]|nr:hypothetical protein [Sedimentisphaerales bacterium]